MNAGAPWNNEVGQSRGDLDEVREHMLERRRRIDSAREAKSG